ncbi:MAG: hypothetical protein DELT_00716 [Desulfovibrio sp.]
MTTRFFRVTGVFLLAVFLSCGFAREAGAAVSSEQILDYDVTAVFDPSGEMEVTENITVVATGRKIKRGIFRTFSVMWDRADNKRFQFDYTIKSVTRDGKPEPYSVTKNNDEIRVRAGKGDVLLTPGVYKYTITYTVRNAFSRFPEWDELYWNVTGNEWEFPIRQVRFRLFYRENASAPLQPMPVRSLDVYTGKLGAQGENARILADNTIETIAPLRLGEGMTVAWTWPRGFLKNAPDPVEFSLFRKLFLPRGSSFLLFAIPLLVGLYFARIAARFKSGPMPEIIPLFRAPEGFTPGQLRYVTKKRYDSTSFAADLLNIVAKGAAHLAEWKDKQTLKRGPGTRRTFRNKALQLGEQKAVEALFASSTSIVITKSNRRQIDNAKKAMRAGVVDEKKGLLLPIIRHLVFGGLLLFLLPVIAFWLQPGEGPILFTIISVFIIIWAAGIGTFMVSIISGITSFRTFLANLPVLFFFTPFVVALGVMCFFLLPTIVTNVTLPDGFCGAFCLGLIVWLTSARLLPRRTREGRRRYAIAQGLAMYLGTAERDRFAELYPPEESVEHFEELLPYALALDKGKTWANRFQKYLDETGETAEAFDHDSWRSIDRFRSSTASALVSSTRSSGGGSSGRSSGSGSSGGGSSGGGGGGRGGGGW